MAQIPCPKCSGVMEEGFVIDNTHHTKVQPQWAQGPAERSFWSGVKLRGRETYPVVTFRCTRCSYLESYAPGEAS